MEIVLIRHGRPVSAINQRLSASGFSKWIQDYNLSKVCHKCPPPNTLKSRVNQHYVVSSALPRAIHSAKLCVGKTPDLVLDKLKEVDVPQLNIPLKIDAYSWIILNGLCWWVGIHGHVESYRQGKLRAKDAAEILSSLALTKTNVAVFGHIITNYLIAIELILNGWRAKLSGKSFWSTLAFTHYD
jgi:broad specificity phosphatase PhoE